LKQKQQPTRWVADLAAILNVTEEQLPQVLVRVLNERNLVPMTVTIVVHPAYAEPLVTLGGVTESADAYQALAGVLMRLAAAMNAKAVALARASAPPDQAPGGGSTAEA